VVRIWFELDAIYVFIGKKYECETVNSGEGAVWCIKFAMFSSFLLLFRAIRQVESLDEILRFGFYVMYWNGKRYS